MSHPLPVRLAPALIAAAVLLLTPAATRADDQGASWTFAPAAAPEPPSGVAPSPFPTALGPVGDIEFWAPDRGVLITAGNQLVPAGLYAYDGVSWHQLSSVCGGTHGRIAWAGPDEFWTISDQRPGQVTPVNQPFLFDDVSLCHFQNGHVVGSYAVPVAQPDSYRPMDAATCAGPADCWFGGALGVGSGSGAFHLHWNGEALSVLYSPQDHAIASMATDQGQIYESVQLEPGDSYTDSQGNEESSSDPPLLHTLVSADASNPFHDVFAADTQDPDCGEFCPPLPEYGSETVDPETLGGFALSTDWSPSGEGPGSTQLWAIAGPDRFGRPPEGRTTASPIALRLTSKGWTQVIPDLAILGPGEDPTGVAADPDENAAWITIASEDETAHVEELSSPDAGQTWEVSERDLLGPGPGVGSRGQAGPIACPAAHDCWLATTTGWLYHLTDGSQPAADSDPMFDGGDPVITYRPPDDGLPEVLPDQPPPDDSLANQPPAAEDVTGGPSTEQPLPTTGTAKALLSHVHSRLLRHDVLELSFTLTGTAHVQLLASRHGRVVARTRKQTLRKGKHALKLQLNTSAWPTKLDLRATPAG
jgi:hypothetical protein